MPSPVHSSPKQDAPAVEPTGEWLTVKEVAAWLKVSEHHVYQTLRRMPGCEPINVGKSQKGLLQVRLTV